MTKDTKEPDGMPREIWAWEEGELFETMWSNFQPSNEAPAYIKKSHHQSEIDKRDLLIEKQERLLRLCIAQMKTAMDLQKSSIKKALSIQKAIRVINERPKQ